jgi:peptidoglycan hydrolase CwlO-like protein
MYYKNKISFHLIFALLIFSLNAKAEINSQPQEKVDIDAKVQQLQLQLAEANTRISNLEKYINTSKQEAVVNFEHRTANGHGRR